MRQHVPDAGILMGIGLLLSGGCSSPSIVVGDGGHAGPVAATGSCGRVEYTGTPVVTSHPIDPEYVGFRLDIHANRTLNGLFEELGEWNGEQCVESGTIAVSVDSVRHGVLRFPSQWSIYLESCITAQAEFGRESVCANGEQSVRQSIFRTKRDQEVLSAAWETQFRKATKLGLGVALSRLTQQPRPERNDADLTETTTASPGDPKVLIEERVNHALENRIRDTKPPDSK